MENLNSPFSKLPLITVFSVLNNRHRCTRQQLGSKSIRSLELMERDLMPKETRIRSGVMQESKKMQRRNRQREFSHNRQKASPAGGNNEGGMESCTRCRRVEILSRIKACFGIHRIYFLRLSIDYVLRIFSALLT